MLPGGYSEASGRARSAWPPPWRLRRSAVRARRDARSPRARRSRSAAARTSAMRVAASSGVIGWCSTKLTSWTWSLSTWSSSPVAGAKGGPSASPPCVSARWLLPVQDPSNHIVRCLSNVFYRRLCELVEQTVAVADKASRTTFAPSVLDGCRPQHVQGGGSPSNFRLLGWSASVDDGRSRTTDRPRWGRVGCSLTASDHHRTLPARHLTEEA